MEKINKAFITITIFIIIVAVLGLTVYKVVNNHNDKLLLVKSEYIIEIAKSCLNEKKCTGTKVTLKTLYDLGYIETQVNPVTKEYYSEDAYVLKEDTEYNFYPN